MDRLVICLSLCATMLSFNTGCLFVRHSTKVVREKEKIQPARFESQQAEQYFLAGVHDLQTHKPNFDVQVSAVPLLWWYSRTSVLSDNAVYNDQLTACDLNADGVISASEAVAFRTGVAEQIAKTEKEKATANESKTASNMPPVSASVSGDSPKPPPALINVSSTHSSE